MAGLYLYTDEQFPTNIRYTYTNIHYTYTNIHYTHKHTQTHTNTLKDATHIHTYTHRHYSTYTHRHYSTCRHTHNYKHTTHRHTLPNTKT